MRYSSACWVAVGHCNFREADFGQLHRPIEKFQTNVRMARDSTGGPDVSRVVALPSDTRCLVLSMAGAPSAFPAMIS